MIGADVSADCSNDAGSPQPERSAASSMGFTRTSQTSQSRLPSFTGLRGKASSGNSTHAQTAQRSGMSFGRKPRSAFTREATPVSLVLIPCLVILYPLSEVACWLHVYETGNIRTCSFALIVDCMFRCRLIRGDTCKPCPPSSASYFASCQLLRASCH